MKQITIVGAGLVGSLLSIYLSKKGFSVNVFEQRPDMRKEKILGGRSINLALSNRGWNALKEVGIDSSIKEIALPMYKRTMHDIDGVLSQQTYGINNEAIYSVSRSELNKRLIDFAEEQKNVSIYFNSYCKDIEVKTATAIFLNKRKKNIKVNSDHLFGADGANSIIRKSLEKQLKIRNSVHFIKHGYKELNIPSDKKGHHVLDKESLHIWPRKDFMLIALPNLDGSFTCTLFLPLTGKNSFASIKTPQSVIEFFEKYFSDVLPISPFLADDFFLNTTSPLGTVDCYPWSYLDKVALIGDAAHAIVPFYGQGMNAGFEDCSILNKLINTKSWNKIFSQYQILRKSNTDAISNLSLHNFLVMRDKTANPLFLLQKEIERWFSDLHPDKWKPLYSMVTFSNLPYSQALQCGEKQDKIMKEVLKFPNITNNWKSRRVEKLILSLLN